MSVHSQAGRNPASPGLGDAVLEALADAIAARVIVSLAPLLAASASSRSPWLTVEEAAERLAAPRSRIYELTRTGKLRSYRDGRRVLLRVEDIDQLPTEVP